MRVIIRFVNIFSSLSLNIVLSLHTTSRCRVLSAGVVINCPPIEPLYTAVRALIWLGQVVGVVGRMMKPLELERVYAATVSVPITDRYEGNIEGWCTYGHYASVRLYFAIKSV